MLDIIIEISNYLMIILFALYTFECFWGFRRNISKEKRDRILSRQCMLIYLIHLVGFNIIYIATDDVNVIIFYFAQVALLTVIQTGYIFLYENASRMLTNHLCMFLALGFIMLTRLSFQKAIRQFAIAVISVILGFIVPVCVKRVGFVRKMYVLFAVLGIAGLLLVAIAGATSYGAKLSIAIAGISIQPTELIKIAFVFFAAGMLYLDTSFKNVCITTILAAIHVLILVYSKDLGAALIFFITYLVILYVATRKIFYFSAGILVGCIASVVGYNLFSHVRVRVRAWENPLSVVDNEGYQVCQSLFGIGTGGWLGMGLYQGTPNKVPVVEEDFIFSAIAEELGGIFALCLIMVCASCFLLFMNIAMQMRDQFYKLVALGLGIIYGFQVILTIGGAIKFIPSTGVTLPLISYGGSSLLSSIIIFAIIQGLYLKQSEGESENTDGKKSGKKQSGTKTKRKKTGFDADIENFS